MTCKSLLPLAIATACIMAGCAHPTLTELVLVVDYSGSTQSGRTQQQAVLASVLESATPGAHFSLFRMGADTEEVMSGSLDETPIEAVVAKLRETTGRSDSRPGTNFARMAEAVAERLKTSRANRIELLIATDGGDDFTSSAVLAEVYSASVRRICTDQRVEAVTFVGVSPANRRQTRSAWGSAGNRLHLLDPEQVPNR